jgi:Domain of unknown function (DUF4126)
MTGVLNILTAFGLSGSAGLNAYLPLLVVALLARFTHLIQLREPWTALTSGWTIAVLVLLLIVETIADKVPAVNHVNDVIQTVIRPVAGAILFAASSNVIGDIHPVLALVCGLFVAGSVHVVKSAAIRPAVTAISAAPSGGVATIPANIIVSTLEDIVAIVTSLVAILVPVLLALVLLIAVVAIAWWLLNQQHARQSRA